MPLAAPYLPQIARQAVAGHPGEPLRCNRYRFGKEARLAKEVRSRSAPCGAPRACWRGVARRRHQVLGQGNCDPLRWTREDGRRCESKTAPWSQGGLQLCCGGRPIPKGSGGCFLDVLDPKDLAVQQIVSRAVVSTEIVDILDAAGVEAPDISIFFDEFLAEVQGLDKKNLAMEALRKLLSGEIRSQSRVNVVQTRAVLRAA
jgi:hypothetical protein